MIEVPTSILLLCRQGAYIVGSFAEHLRDNSLKFNDYDLIVPPPNWCYVAPLIPKNAKLNSYGGIKFTDDKNNSIDIWPSSIEQYLRQYTGKGEACVIDYMASKVFITKEGLI